MEKEILFNADRSKDNAIRWTLNKAKELFVENKKLIISKCINFRPLQACTMNLLLPSYMELADFISIMIVIFENNKKLVETKECERLLSYLVLYKGE